MDKINAMALKCMACPKEKLKTEGLRLLSGCAIRMVIQYLTILNGKMV
jgi:hypothetical protein